jgi:hypothetical protein
MPNYRDVKCEICGVNWGDHDPACVGERYRPKGQPKPCAATVANLSESERREVGR